MAQIAYEDISLPVREKWEEVMTRIRPEWASANPTATVEDPGEAVIVEPEVEVPTEVGQVGGEVEGEEGADVVDLDLD